MLRGILMILPLLAVAFAAPRADTNNLKALLELKRALQTPQLSAKEAKPQASERLLNMLQRLSIPGYDCVNKDSDANCNSWASHGFCITDYQWMADNCYLACAFHDECANPSQGSCTNNAGDEHCDWMRDNGACQDHQQHSYMNQHCHLSCNRDSCRGK